MSKNNINHIDLVDKIEGYNRRLDIMKMPLENNSFLPKTVNYKDIDLSVKEWVDKIKINGDDGKAFPTITLYSSQRFSEYSQTWKYTDSNNNLLLNFKTVSRDNNPQYGSIQNKYYNIPGDIFFTINKKRVLDDNGNESFRVLKMRQPLAVDLIFKMSIFTNKYELINEFNTKINRVFATRQTYISPNGYYMPMVLENISDESEYKIDDRQFYSQTFNIKVMAFLITEEDFRVDEVPLKFGVNIDGLKKYIKKPEAEIEECDAESPYYYKPTILTLTYPLCKTNKCKFTIDIDFVCEDIQMNNVKNNYKILNNGDEIDKTLPFKFNEGDEIEVIINKRLIDKESKFIMNGYNPSIVYDENLDEPEIEMDNKQKIDDIEIEN